MSALPGSVGVWAQPSLHIPALAWGCAGGRNGGDAPEIQCIGASVFDVLGALWLWPSLS